MCNKGYDYVRELYLESFENILYNQKVFNEKRTEDYKVYFTDLIKDL